MGKKLKQQTCYMCGKLATTVEHVPCKSFFPEKDDISSDKDNRKNLVTVPSCPEHNLSKSKDDEYLFFVILSAGANTIAHGLFSSKAMRAFRRRAHLVGLITKDMIPALYNGIPTMAYRVDDERFTRAVTFMARALYYNSYREKWLEDIRIYSPDLLIPNRPEGLQNNAEISKWCIVIEDLLRNERNRGENPLVFYYKIYRDISLKMLCIRMVFYERTVIIAFSAPLLDLPE